MRMRLLGWKRGAASVLIGSLAGVATNAVYASDGLGVWRSLDGASIVLSTDESDKANEDVADVGESSDSAGFATNEDDADADVGDSAGFATNEDDADADVGDFAGFAINEDDANVGELGDSVGFAGGVSGDFGALAEETAALRAELAALREETAALKVDFEAAKAKEAEAAAPKKADPNAPFSLRFSGRAVADATLTSADADFTDFYGETSNIWRLRDVCLTLRGSGYGNLEYKFCLAIAEKPKIYDFYLGCKDTRYFGDERIGQFHVESGCESLELLYETS
ncbi:MAG: hypothetical protein IJE97_09135, partial [Thermoguttaceae bacterium]|nr:hypothetical protein [Thermoguttaceae bacterium]